VDQWKPYFNPKEMGEFDNAMFNSMYAALQNGDIFKLFEHNMKASGLSDMVSTLKGSSAEVLPILKTGFFDLIFIDGDHRYKAIKNDFELAAPLLKEGGVICGDDLVYQWHEFKPGFVDSVIQHDLARDPEKPLEFHPGVTKAVYEFFNGPVTLHAGFFAMQKVDANWRPVDFSFLGDNPEIPAHARPVDLSKELNPFN
jgi:hypothetical protein